MKLDDNGAAFFVEGCNEDREVIPPELATSPLPELHNLPPSWTKEDVEEASDERGTSSNSSRDQSRTRQVVQEPLEAVEATKKPSTRRKRKRKGKGHARGGSKSSMKDFTSGNDAPDDIFTMDDVVKEPQLGTSLPEDLAGTPTPTNPTQPAPLPKTSVVDVHADVAGDDQAQKHARVRPRDAHDAGAFVAVLLLFQAARNPRTSASRCQKFILTESSSRSWDVGTRSWPWISPNRQPSAKKSSMQYFSEPEMSPVTSPMGSRPGSPVLSDTEFESQRRAEEQQQLDENEQSWEWGKLPTNSPSTPDRAKSEDLKKDEEKTESRGWGLSYLWRGSGKQKAKEEAVYLEDLKDDEEMLKIYVGSHPQQQNEPGADRRGRRRVRKRALVAHESPFGGRRGADEVRKRIRSERRRCFVVRRSECASRVLDAAVRTGQVVLWWLRRQIEDQGRWFVQQPQPRPSGSANNTTPGKMPVPSSCPRFSTAVSLPSDLVDVFSGSYQEPKCEQPEPEAEASATSAATTAAESTKRNSSWWPFGSKRDSGEPLKSGDVTPKEKEDLEEDSDKAINEAEEKEPLPAARKSRDAVNVSTSSDCSTGDEFLAVIGGIKADRYRKTLRLSNELIVSIVTLKLSHHFPQKKKKKVKKILRNIHFNLSNFFYWEFAIHLWLMKWLFSTSNFAWMFFDA